MESIYNETKQGIEKLKQGLTEALKNHQYTVAWQIEDYLNDLKCDIVELEDLKETRIESVKLFLYKDRPSLQHGYLPYYPQLSLNNPKKTLEKLLKVKMVIDHVLTTAKTTVIIETDDEDNELNQWQNAQDSWKPAYDYYIELLVRHVMNTNYLNQMNNYLEWMEKMEFKPETLKPLYEKKEQLIVQEKQRQEEQKKRELARIETANKWKATKKVKR
jgi:hypothetical protein